jgi:hypothetical protein
MKRMKKRSSHLLTRNMTSVGLNVFGKHIKRGRHVRGEKAISFSRNVTINAEILNGMFPIAEKNLRLTISA